MKSKTALTRLDAELSQKLESATEILAKTWRQGRHVLVVLGAGASVSAPAGVPRMSQIFQQLEKKINNLVSAWRTKMEDSERAPRSSHGAAESYKNEYGRLSELQSWFESLSREGAPRSIAAMALGTMQRAHKHRASGDFFKAVDDVWQDFSKGFIQEMSAEKLPTKIHKMVANWAILGAADLISVNFDGLTRQALEDQLKATETPSSAIVLSEPKEIAGYFLGDRMEGQRSLFPVVKVWGDVFHAICTEQQCPQFGRRAPIFRMTPGGKDTMCPDCQSERQLQIFFVGYEEKEKSTTDTMKELMRYIAPRIGCILTVGFSGLWDQALVRFLVTVCADLDREGRWQSRLIGKSREIEEGAKKSSNPSFWINVDPDPQPALLQEIASFGISCLHLAIKAEDFADKAPLYEPLAVKSTQPFTSEGSLPEGKWEDVIKEKKACPAAYKVFVAEALTGEPGYLADLSLLRQLGVKTQIALAAAIGHDEAARRDPKHNRRNHSFGAAHLAVLWFRNLVEGPNLALAAGERERLATVAMCAAIHHDIGHLPFTHLSEEIFGEVNWTVEDWSGEFHHDEAVLANCAEGFKEQIFRATDQVAEIVGASPHEFRVWVEGAIEARSGYHWVDAVLNSPLDVDKLDYVLRDCEYLRQGIHVPLEKRASERWLEDLFNESYVLPSGLIALRGRAGEHARDFLEERRWLYKHQYHQPGFRAIEKLAGSVILHWLLQRGAERIIEDPAYKVGPLGDTSALKGRVARQLLWEGLKEKGGEPELLIDVCKQLAEPPGKKMRGLPIHPQLGEWAAKCLHIFDAVFKGRDSGSKEEFDLHQLLSGDMPITCSETIHVPIMHLRKIREIVRQIETLHPFRAVFDIAPTPRMLSYPPRRMLSFVSSSLCGECFAVSHTDPDRWGISNNNWIPLSQSAFSERDKNRWAKVMVVSPESNDPDVTYALDRFRNACGQHAIPYSEVDPEESMT